MTCNCNQSSPAHFGFVSPSSFKTSRDVGYIYYFSPGLGTVGVGWGCGPIDNGGGASADPVGAPDPLGAASQCCTNGNVGKSWLKQSTENTDQNVPQGVRAGGCLLGSLTHRSISIILKAQDNSFTYLHLRMYSTSTT